MKRVRLGAVGYLNARPLVFGVERSARFDLRFDVPSRCAELLHEQRIDLGLIPSIEYLRHPAAAESPDGSPAYRIVPDLAIASRGPVASVALFTTRPMPEVRSISMDTSSRTSVALTRVLCARHFRIDPAIESQGPDLGAMLDRCDAALVIGHRDAAATTRRASAAMTAGSSLTFVICARNASRSSSGSVRTSRLAFASEGMTLMR